VDLVGSSLVTEFTDMFYFCNDNFQNLYNQLAKEILPSNLQKYTYESMRTTKNKPLRKL